MKWAPLITEERFYASGASKPPDQVKGRSRFSPTQFQEDIQRIINCSAFRRLQGKTQVFSFPPTDYVRNRLTHTIEVARVGRTLASRITGELSDAATEAEKELLRNIPDIVE